jgi:Lipocalin-like domain
MTTRTIGQRLCSTFAAITLSTLLSVLGLVPLTGDAVAQSAKDLVGAWTFVSAVNTRPDGTKFDPNGGNPTGGMLFFASTGQFSWQTIRFDIPKLASNNRSQGTADEFKAVAQGVFSYFGTYSLDDSGKTLTQNVKASSFPNLNDGKRIWAIAITGDELTLLTQAAASGGTAELKWKRVK